MLKNLIDEMFLLRASVGQLVCPPPITPLLYLSVPKIDISTFFIYQYLLVYVYVYVYVYVIGFFLKPKKTIRLFFETKKTIRFFLKPKKTEDKKTDTLSDTRRDLGWHQEPYTY